MPGQVGSRTGRVRIMQGARVGSASGWQGEIAEGVFSPKDTMKQVELSADRESDERTRSTSGGFCLQRKQRRPPTIPPFSSPLSPVSFLALSSESLPPSILPPSLCTCSLCPGPKGS